MCLPGEELRFPDFHFPDFQISGFYANCLCFQIVPTGKPSPLTACQIVNKTLTSLKVQCQEGRKSLLGKPRYSSSAFISGFDGGLPANFLLELYDAEKMELKSQVTNKVPIFEVIINIICKNSDHQYLTKKVPIFEVTNMKFKTNILQTTNSVKKYQYTKYKIQNTNKYLN